MQKLKREQQRNLIRKVIGSRSNSSTKFSEEWTGTQKQLICFSKRVFLSCRINLLNREKGEREGEMSDQSTHDTQEQQKAGLNDIQLWNGSSVSILIFLHTGARENNKHSINRRL